MLIVFGIMFSETDKKNADSTIQIILPDQLFQNILNQSKILDISSMMVAFESIMTKKITRVGGIRDRTDSDKVYKETFLKVKFFFDNCYQKIEKLDSSKLNAKEILILKQLLDLKIIHDKQQAIFLREPHSESISVDLLEMVGNTRPVLSEIKKAGYENSYYEDLKIFRINNSDIKIAEKKLLGHYILFVWEKSQVVFDVK